MAQPSLQPGRDLVRRVRIGFIGQDSSLSAWCREHGVHIGNARQALIGSWDGPKARDLRTRILKAARLSVAA